MQECSQDEQWHVDRRQIVGKPTRQIDVGHRTSLRPKLLGQHCEGTPKPVRRKDDTLGPEHNSGDGCTPI